MLSAEQKIKLVKEISEFHPGYSAGKKYGFSYYVGGMADTGGWHTMKMLEAPDQQLLACLEELKEESKPVKHTYTTQELIDMNTPTTHRVGNGKGIIHSNVYDDKQWKELQEKIETKLIWG